MHRPMLPAWVATQPESFERADDVRKVVQRWMETDADAADAVGNGSSRRYES